MEHEVGGKSVAEIFKHYGERFFRDKEVSCEALLFIYILQIFMFGDYNYECMMHQERNF